MYFSVGIVDCRVAVYGNCLVMQGEALTGESMKVKARRGGVGDAMEM